MVSRRCVSKGAMWYVAVTASKCYIKIGLTNFLKRGFFVAPKMFDAIMLENLQLH